MHYRNVRDRAIKAFCVTLLRDSPFDEPYTILFGEDGSPDHDPDFYVGVECYQGTEEINPEYVVTLTMTLDAFANVFDLHWKGIVLQWPESPGTYTRHDRLGLLEPSDMIFNDMMILDGFRDYDTRFHFTE